MGRAYEVRKASIQKTGAAKGKIYSMYAKEIYQAAKTGGTSLEANEKLKVAIKAIDKANKNGVTSKNTSARNKSRLTKKVNSME